MKHERSEPGLPSTFESWQALEPILLTVGEIVAPPPDRSASQWADANRSFPPGTAEPGPHRSARAPWTIEISRLARIFFRVVIVMGSQMSKTTLLLNIGGRKIDDDPAPVLYFGPTKSNIDGVIEPQVAAMIRSAPSLRAKLEKGKRSKYVKRIAGVTWRLAWAGSPTELASQPAHTILADEVDRMEPIKGEGDPVSLADARKDTYPDGLLVIASTPTEGKVEVEKHPDTGLEHWKIGEPEQVLSAVWKFYQEGTRFEWAVPCPECHEHFVPRFRNLWYPPDCTPKRALSEARLICSACGVQIEDKHRHAMNAQGHFVAPGQRVENGVVVGEPPESDTASVWVSGLMSPWRTFGQRAAAWIRAVMSGDPDRMRTVMNTAFGELFAMAADAPTAEVVEECKENYQSGEVPAGVRLITAYVDVQKRKFVYSVRGWGDSMESWLIEAGEIWGETEHDKAWLELAEFRERRFGDRQLAIRRLGIDSGYRPGDKWRRPDNQIYSFCRRYRGWAIATKGRDRQLKPLQPSLIDVTWKGQVIKNGLQLWNMDSDYFKSWVHARLEWPEKQPGGWHVPLDVTADFCKQITAEARTVTPTGQVKWVRLRRENHYLDCEAGNTAVAYSLGVHRIRKRTKPKADVDAKPAEPAAAAETPPPQRPQPTPAQRVNRTNQMRRPGWVKNWRW